MPARQEGLALLSMLLITAIAVILLNTNIHTSMGFLAKKSAYADQFELNELRHYAEYKSLDEIERLRNEAERTLGEHLSRLSSGSEELFSTRHNDWQIQVRVFDLHASLNINRIPIDTGYLQAFDNLLAGRIGGSGASVADWLDTDSEIGMLGAEDFTYLAQNPAYLPSNRSAIRASEIRLVHGINAETWQKIKPLIVALPPGAKTNVYSASETLLRALAPTMDIYAIASDSDQPDPDLAPSEAFAGTPESANLFATESRYFDLEYIFTRNQRQYRYKTRIDTQNNSDPIMLRTPVLDIEPWLYPETAG